MKQITPEQCNALLKLLIDLNIPVQAFKGVEAMINNLPDASGQGTSN